MKRWIIVALLLAVSLWTANLTLFNWWAAGGPPTPNPQQYAMRGNVFAVATLLLWLCSTGSDVRDEPCHVAASDHEERLRDGVGVRSKVECELLNPIIRADPNGLTSHKGFSPEDQQLMEEAVEKAKAKMKEKPCCYPSAPKVFDKRVRLLPAEETRDVVHARRHREPAA